MPNSMSAHRGSQAPPPDPNLHPAIVALDGISRHYTDPTRPFEEIYDTTIKPIAESPYFFNSYHWTTNIAKQKLVYVAGVDKVLGYDIAQFDFLKSFEIIHPNYRDFVLEYGVMAYRMLKEPEYHALSPYSHYCIQYPVRHAKGHYILVQMNASVIQTDSKGNAIANYNRFEVLGPYLEVPIVIRPRVYFRGQAFERERALRAERDITKRVSGIMLKQLGFTKTEIIVLRKFAEGLKSEEIIESLNITKETLKSHSKNILSKMRKRLCDSFWQIKDVVFYLKKIEII